MSDTNFPEPVFIDLSDDPRHKQEMKKLEAAEREFQSRAADARDLESSKVAHASDLLARMTGSSKSDAETLVRLIRS